MLFYSVSHRESKIEQTSTVYVEGNKIKELKTASLVGIIIVCNSQSTDTALNETQRNISYRDLTR